MFETTNNQKNCCCRGLKGLIKPCILLHIAIKPMHGYELLESLGDMELPTPPDPGGLYRLLRSMEQDGLLESAWETNDSGPARRIYQLTPVGKAHLGSWIGTLSKTREWLDDFLAEYEQLFHQEITKVEK